MKKNFIALSAALCMTVSLTACGDNNNVSEENSESENLSATENMSAEIPSEETAEETETPSEEISINESASELEYWTEDSQAAESIREYVDAVCDENGEYYVPSAERIAVFDVDGTLIRERFPTYFDQCMLIHRLLHDDTYEAPEEDREFAEELEYALLNGEPEPDAPRSSAQMAAESFKGFTVEEYSEYVRDFMSETVEGFEGMTYGEGFFKPMVSLVQYLSEHDFKVFICSGGERIMLRELIKGTLDEWIPPYQVIGTTFSLTAPGQGETADRSYTYTADDEIILEGNMIFKNLKIGKVKSIVSEIGCKPILAFGNSSGDFAMGEYTVQNGGKAYMLLCDDTERDYGDIEVAESFAEECDELGFETISMKDDFATIYGDEVKCVAFATVQQ